MTNKLWEVYIWFLSKTVERVILELLDFEAPLFEYWAVSTERFLDESSPTVSFLTRSLKMYSHFLLLDSILKGYFRRKNYLIVGEKSENHHFQSQIEWLFEKYYLIVGLFNSRERLYVAREVEGKER